MSQDILFLGAAPRPTTDDDLTARLRTAVIEALPAGSATDALSVAATLAGDDIATLNVALTNVVIPTITRKDARNPLGSGEVTTSTPMVIQNATLSGNPLRVAGAAVSVSGQLANVPAAWVQTADGRVGIQPVEPNDASSPVQGSGMGEISKADLNTAAATIGQAMAADMGVTLSDLNIDVRQVTERQVRVEAAAKVKKGIIGASANVSATASVDQNQNVTISDLDVSSKNPVIGALLSVVRGRLERFNNRTISINDRLPAGVKLSSLEFSVGETIVLKGTIG